MEPLDLITVVSLLASTASITLAVAAFIFGWRTFVKSSEMQMKAQASLEKISEKAEVIAGQTSGQIEKAWDYFTRPQLERAPEEIEKLEKQQEDQKKAIVDEAKKEVFKGLEEAGISGEIIKSMDTRIGRIMEETTNKAAKSTTDSRVTRIEEMTLLIMDNLNAMARKQGGPAVYDMFGFKPEAVSISWFADVLRDARLAESIFNLFQFLGQSEKEKYKGIDWDGVFGSLDHIYKQVYKRLMAL